jgi:hypothetical protein
MMLQKQFQIQSIWKLFLCMSCWKSVCSIYTFIFFFAFFPSFLFAGFYMQNTLGFQNSQSFIPLILSNDDNLQNQQLSRFFNILSLGATFGKSNDWVIGQNFMIWTLQEKRAENLHKHSFFETGPRLQYFWNKNQNFYTAISYHFLGRGKRSINGESDEVSGTSLLFSTGLSLPLTSALFFGTSLNWHQISLKSRTFQQQQETINQNYKNLFFSIDLSYRFYSSGGD